LRKYTEALADLNKSIELEPEDPDAYSNRAFTYAQLGQFEEAQKDVEKAISLDVENATPYFARGVCLALQKKPEAAQDFTKFEEKSKGRENFYWFELKTMQELRGFSFKNSKLIVTAPTSSSEKNKERSGKKKLRMILNTKIEKGTAQKKKKL
jgi:tetratricopeptide (TPR) repeat protein